MDLMIYQAMPIWLRETNVDSHFNPIIGVGSCLKLGLIQLQNPMYTGWSDLLVLMSM